MNTITDSLVESVYELLGDLKGSKLARVHQLSRRLGVDGRTAQELYHRAYRFKNAIDLHEQANSYLQRKQK